MTPQTTIRTGDVLTRKKAHDLITHVGVALAPDLVLHNTPEKGEHVGTLQEFADGKPVTLHRLGADPSIVLARAQAVLASPQKYHPIKNNCEHTASKVISGISESSQAAFWAMIALIVAVVVLVMFAVRKQRA